MLMIHIIYDIDDIFSYFILNILNLQIALVLMSLLQNMFGSFQI